MPGGVRRRANGARMGGVRRHPHVGAVGAVIANATRRPTVCAETPRHIATHNARQEVAGHHHCMLSDRRHMFADLAPVSDGATEPPGKARGCRAARECEHPPAGTESPLPQAS